MRCNTPQSCTVIGDGCCHWRVLRVLTAVQRVIFSGWTRCFDTVGGLRDTKREPLSPEVLFMEEKLRGNYQTQVHLEKCRYNGDSSSELVEECGASTILWHQLSMKVK